MPFTVNGFLRTVAIRNIWMFITDACNLECDYCFFSEKKGLGTLRLDQARALFSCLPKDGPLDFVISGGEPLLRWEHAKSLMEEISGKFPRANLTLQTNSLLLTSAHLAFLKRRAVTVEPGIDGGYKACSLHRKGFTMAAYGKFQANIRRLARSGVRINPTMTVHPAEAGAMAGNFRELLALGLRSIDIHPAFLAPWTKPRADTFLREYRMMLLRERREGRHIVCKNYSVPSGMAMDLVIQPDGSCLPNWTFLAFPRKVREKFVYMRIGREGIEVDAGFLGQYLKKLRGFYGRKERSYRDFSNFNAAMAVAASRRPALARGFSCYRQLTEKIQALDRDFLRKEDMR